ncbi:MAG: MBL fold metallo-hydrolase [Synergistaceae bacterium]|nr:MBL fold metallo-hydrolase [Synergistaceae bacterium]
MKYKRFPLGPLLTNSYLLWEAGGAAFLVDPAGELSEVRSFLSKNELSLKEILLTHGHFDHVGGLEEALSITGGSAYVSSGDAFLVKNPDAGVRAWMGSDFTGTDKLLFLQDGDRLSVGTMDIKVIATPGHTPGCVCYLVTDGADQLLLSGDTLFASSIGRTDLPGGDSGLLEKSLLRLAQLPDTLPVLPGHGPETTIGAEQRENPFWPTRERYI